MIDRPALTESLTLRADNSSVRQARLAVGRLSERAGLDADAVDLAVLLTSETVTNAVIHGRSAVQVRVTADGERLLVEVTDDNSRHPVLQCHDPDALGGRGMNMVEALASSWGVRDERIGKTVWFELRTR